MNKKKAIKRFLIVVVVLLLSTSIIGCARKDEMYEGKYCNNSSYTFIG